jgi:hypothetical protein
VLHSELQASRAQIRKTEEDVTRLLQQLDVTRRELEAAVRAWCAVPRVQCSEKAEPIPPTNLASIAFVLRHTEPGDCSIAQRRHGAVPAGGRGTHKTRAGVQSTAAAA